jgi:hypothetical protein
MGRRSTLTSSAGHGSDSDLGRARWHLRASARTAAEECDYACVRRTVITRARPLRGAWAHRARHRMVRDVPGAAQGGRRPRHLRPPPDVRAGHTSSRTSWSGTCSRTPPAAAEPRRGQSGRKRTADFVHLRLNLEGMRSCRRRRSTRRVRSPSMRRPRGSGRGSCRWATDEQALHLGSPRQHRLRERRRRVARVPGFDGR